MALETATDVGELNPVNPTAGDPKSQGDDHIRTIKDALQATLPEGSRAHYPLVAGTATATTSGTAHDYTSIPSWVKRITVQLSGVSTNGTSLPIVQIGDSGGVETSGYAGSVFLYASGDFTQTFSSGFAISAVSAAGSVYDGTIVLSLLDSATNTWVAGITVGASSGAAAMVGGGSKSLSATLDRVRITTVNGTDAFDAGKVNILYE